MKMKLDHELDGSPVAMQVSCGPTPSILLVSYAFPPMHVPMTPVVAKIAVGLARIGCHVDVICADAFDPRLGRDESLLAYVRNSVASITPIAPRGWRDFLARRLASPRREMDAMHFLQRRASDILEALPLERYTAVLSFSPFHSVNVVLAALKRRRPGMRWVAQFSDPWANNPLETSARRDAWGRRNEPTVVKMADRLIYTSAPARDLMLGPFDGSLCGKAIVLPHSWDGALYPQTRTRPRERLVLRHIGTLFDTRSPEPLFLAARDMLRRRPELDGTFAFHFVGHVPDFMMKTEAARSLPAGTVTRDRAVPYLDSLKLMTDADALVLIEPDVAFNLFVPSKLADYVGADKPILALAPPGASRQLLDHLGLPYFVPSDVGGISTALELLIQRSAQADRFAARPDRRAMLHNDAVARRYLEVVVESAGQPPAPLAAAGADRP